MDSAIMAANERQEYLTQDWQERDLERRRFLAELDYNTGIRYAREEGKEEVARNALAENLPIDVIQKITGLDMETIQKLSG